MIDENNKLCERIGEKGILVEKELAEFNKKF